MNPRVKRRLVASGVALGFLGICLNLVAFAHARAMTHFSGDRPRTAAPETLGTDSRLKALFLGVDLPRPHSDIPPTRLGTGTRAIEIPVPGGIRLGAWYCPGEPGRPLAILFHGYGGEKTGCLAEAGMLHSMGLATFLVDFRGAGASSESYTTIGYLEAEDVAAAVDYAREHFPAPKVVLYGHSMGGVAILRAVAECGVKPDGMIVESVFDTLLNTVRRRFDLMGMPSFPFAQLLVFWGGAQFGFNGFRHNPVRYAGAVRCPVVFFHGASDSRARIEDARLVYDAVPGLKEFVAFADLGHEPGVLRHPVEWRDAVTHLLGGLPGERGGKPARPGSDGGAR